MNCSTFSFDQQQQQQQTALAAQQQQQQTSNFFNITTFAPCKFVQQQTQQQQYDSEEYFSSEDEMMTSVSPIDAPLYNSAYYDSNNTNFNNSNYNNQQQQHLAESIQHSMFQQLNSQYIQYTQQLCSVLKRQIDCTNIATAQEQQQQQLLMQQQCLQQQQQQLYNNTAFLSAPMSSPTTTIFSPSPVSVSVPIATYVPDSYQDSSNLVLGPKSVTHGQSRVGSLVLAPAYQVHPLDEATTTTPCNKRPFQFHIVEHKDIAKSRKVDTQDASYESTTTPTPTSTPKNVVYTLHDSSDELPDEDEIPTEPSSPSRPSSPLHKLLLHPELLMMKQCDAAKALGVSPSVLCKKWREAMHGRKWPYRFHKKLQKEINQTKEILSTQAQPKPRLEGKLKSLRNSHSKNVAPGHIYI